MSGDNTQKPDVVRDCEVEAMEIRWEEGIIVNFLSRASWSLIKLFELPKSNKALRIIPLILISTKEEDNEELLATVHNVIEADVDLLGEIDLHTFAKWPFWSNSDKWNREHDILDDHGTGCHNRSMIVEVCVGWQLQ
jgi:hypothetical protein